MASRSGTLHLRNVPVKERESAKYFMIIFSTITKICNADIAQTDMSAIYRLPGRPGTLRTIVEELSTFLIKNNVLNAVRTFNRQRQIAETLNTKTLDIPSNIRPVYADEHLLPAARKLYNRCPLFPIENGYLPILLDIKWKHFTSKR